MPGYSPVYSAPFIQYTPDTPNTSFIVPDGFTAVVRQCSGFQDIGGWIFYVNIQDSEAAPELLIVAVEQVGAVNYVNVQGRWVVPAGGVISATFSELGSYPKMYVGGYLLRNVAT